MNPLHGSVGIVQVQSIHEFQQFIQKGRRTNKEVELERSPNCCFGDFRFLCKTSTAGPYRRDRQRRLFIPVSEKELLREYFTGLMGMGN